MNEVLDEQDKYAVPGLERGLRLLSEFSRREPQLSAPELARRLQLPRSTIFRLLATLERMGFVQRDERGRDYRLGMGILRLGFEYLASLELTELARPILERLCTELRYATNLVVRDGRHVVYVGKVTPPSLLSTSVTVGTRLPAHATVLGRVLLADMSLAELRELFGADPLEPSSPQTPTSVQDLYDLLQHDRSQEVIVGEGFFEPAISTIAAPIRDQRGQIVAALGITIPDASVGAERRSSLAQAVHAGADELSGFLNRPPTHLR